MTLHKPPLGDACAAEGGVGGEAAVRRAFAEDNWLDVRLYNAARRRFEAHMQVGGCASLWLSLGLSVAR